MYRAYKEGHGHRNQEVCDGIADEPELRIVKGNSLITEVIDVHMHPRYEGERAQNLCSGVPVVVL